MQINHPASGCQELISIQKKWAAEVLNFPANSGEAICKQDYAMNVWYEKPNCQGKKLEKKMIWGDCMMMLI